MDLVKDSDHFEVVGFCQQNAIGGAHRRPGSNLYRSGALRAARTG